MLNRQENLVIIIENVIRVFWTCFDGSKPYYLMFLLLLLPFPSRVQLLPPLTGLSTCIPDRFQSLWFPFQGAATCICGYKKKNVIVADIRYSVQNGDVPTCQLDAEAVGPGQIWWAGQVEDDREAGRTSCYAVDYMLMFVCFFLVLDVLYYCCYGNDDWVFVTGGFQQKIHGILYIIKALKSGLFKRLANNKSLQCCKVGKCSCVRFFPDSLGMAAIFPNIPRASPLLFAGTHAHISAP